MILTYSELIQIPDFTERFHLLYRVAHQGAREWGSQRAINQVFYHSAEWRSIRDMVIVRDKGCNLAHPEYQMSLDTPTIHHIMPITYDDIRHNDLSKLLDMENLITTNDVIHKAIHYGHGDCPYAPIVVRTPYDTCPWRQ